MKLGRVCVMVRFKNGEAARAVTDRSQGSIGSGRAFMNGAVAWCATARFFSTPKLSARENADSEQSARTNGGVLMSKHAPTSQFCRSDVTI